MNVVELHTAETEQHTVEYAGGFDLGPKTFILAGALLGSHTLDNDGSGDTILTASVGTKWNSFKHLLLTTNVQLP